MEYYFSIIGAVFIVLGLYTVVWGKSKDHRNSPDPSEDVKVGALRELPITDIRSAENGSKAYEDAK